MKYTSKQIRTDFISFFKSKNHKIVRSAPLLPINDPTLLFTNAGMNQFKDIFLNKKKPSDSRVVNSQKCIRVSGKHNDLEEVGVDNYHHTFFEMLGNWSFGDYYKKEAISWAWELLTEVWKLDKNRLWITIFKDDDESGELWRSCTDVNPDRILKFDKKDNFWEMGDTGPCGPCTEIHYYTGDNPENQSSDGVNALDDYREIWNLVFIQYNRDENGNLNDLPDKHVDTGAGFERLVAILNGKTSNYDTDLFTPIISEIEELSKLDYDYEDGIPHRVIADHIRMLAFSIADGVMPSNEGRGYVIRRVLRRACRFGRVLKIKEAFLYQLIDILAEVLGDAFPELNDKKEHIKKVIKAEEVSFGKTLDRGLIIIESLIKNLNKGNILKGEDVFLLYDTYGFPIDLTELIVRERGYKIDVDGYNECMNVQKNKARGSQKFKDDSSCAEWTIISDVSANNFIGYKKTKIESEIVKYRQNEDKIEIVCKDTPFYAESGGQIGDAGVIKSEKFNLIVSDTYKIGDDICHLSTIKSGDLSEIKKNNKVQLIIDEDKRAKIKSNHTATHLLHKALKNVLGNHVQQAGSLVADERLRFDLTHYEKISSDDIIKIESIVNEIVIKNYKLNVRELKYDDAKKEGAEALFGEKYDDVVRVVDIDKFSKELCGGTHVERTGDIGFFKITSESSLASGVRRIEAVTGAAALDIANSNYKIINSIKSKLQCSEDEIENKIDYFSEITKQNINLLKEIENYKIDSLIKDNKKFIKVNNLNVLAVKIKDTFNSKYITDRFLNTYSSNAVCLIGMETDKPLIVICGTKDVSEKYNLGKIIKDISLEAGGGGGGPKHFGTSGFKDNKLFTKVYDLLLKQIKLMK